jgi:hypothetical protein
MELWGDILSRMGNADCNYFVTEMVKRVTASGEIPERSLSRDCHSGRRVRLTASVDSTYSSAPRFDVVGFARSVGLGRAITRHHCADFSGDGFEASLLYQPPKRRDDRTLQVT